MLWMMLLLSLVLPTFLPITTFGLKITHLRVPKFVQNGTDESVILDCEYTYNRRKDKNLHLRWYYEDHPLPIYQWLPELDIKRSLDKFRINDNYEIPSGNEYTRYRALNIQRPTTELSGRYRCEVASLDGFDSAEDSMTVYAYPSSVNLNYRIYGETVRINCEVKGVYPFPEMTVFQIDPGETEHKSIDDVQLYSYYNLIDGAYEVELSSEITVKELESTELRFIGCACVLNGTEYKKEVKISLPVHPSSVNLNYRISDGAVHAICEIKGVHPPRGISLFQIEPSETEYISIDDVQLKYDVVDGIYDVKLSSDIPKKGLKFEELSFFGCAVVLNGTEDEKVVTFSFPDRA